MLYVFPDTISTQKKLGNQYILLGLQALTEGKTKYPYETN